MTQEELIQEIAKFAETETQNIIAELQANRFQNDGAFNGHATWKNNHPLVAEEKGFNKPLVETGELRKELTTADNWDLNPKLTKNQLTLSIADRENFTDSKYDKLDIGGITSPYKGRRTGKMVNINSVPARPFKDLSSQDMQWITNKLEDAIRLKFGS